MELHKDLKALAVSAKNNEGSYTHEGVDKTLLEKFPSPFKVENRNGVEGSLNIVAFQSLCPLTLQPDAATIIIDYVPDDFCVESKSLKLYLVSFRNFGEFHESCVNRICNDLVDLLQPKSIKVVGQFIPRGGIPFWPTATWKK